MPITSSTKYFDDAGKTSPASRLKIIKTPPSASEGGITKLKRKLKEWWLAPVIYRELKLKDLYHVFAAAAKTTAVIMFLVAAAMVSAWLITVADIPAKMISLLEPFMGNQTLLLIAIMVLVMAVGTAMDMTPTILIMTPVLMPVVRAAGIDPVYFGVLFIMNNAIGLITPPVGTVLNVVAGVGKMKMDTVTKGVIPFMIAEFALMFLLVFFPSLVTVPAKWFAG